jgi:hypothetical protein
VPQYVAPQSIAGGDVVGKHADHLRTTLKRKTQTNQNANERRGQKFMDQIRMQGSSKAAGFTNSPGDQGDGSIANSMSRGKDAVGVAAAEAMDSGMTDLKALQTI